MDYLASMGVLIGIYVILATSYNLIIGYGGSESMQSPKGLYSNVAKGLPKELGVDIARFETAFGRTLYPSLGLSRGVFFPRETFGRDALVTGDPTATVADDLGKSLLNARPLREFIAQFPISTASPTGSSPATFRRDARA